MDGAILIFGIIGVILFLAYMFFIFKTSYDDEKKKKEEKLNTNGKH